MSVELTKKTCETIGCRATATHVLTWRDRETGREDTESVCEPCGQGYMRRPVLRATLTPMASPEPTPTPQSGYTACACRDCMDTTVDWQGEPALCSLCWEAECVPYEHAVYPGTSYACQRDDAYGDDLGDAGTGHGASEYRSGH